MKQTIWLLYLLTCLGCQHSVTYRVHRQDGADQAVRNILIKRRTEIVDLQAVGCQLVKDYGSKVAWCAVLDVWKELTGGAHIEHASDVIWLLNQTADVESVAWLIQFKDQWLNV